MEKRDIIIAILLFALVFVLGYLVLGQVEEVDPENGEDEIVEEDREEVEEEEEREEAKDQNLEDVILGYLGYPYEADPMDDDENIYNNEAFNSTTLVLVSAVDYNFPNNPEEGMREIHYYPPGEVSYENRLHFSTYRNEVSDYFTDITREIGGDLVESKEVVLNQESEGERLLGIDWEETILLHYIEIANLSEILSDLPKVAGVTFIVDGDEEIGLDVRREGLLIDGDRFIHACSGEGEVVEENLFDFLEGQDYDGVNFFEINE